MQKEVPILFQGEMVQAILEDRKLVTRRIIKPQPNEDGVIFMPNPPCLDWEQIYKEKWQSYLWTTAEGEDISKAECPKGKVGDLMYVRESWAETCDNLGAPIVVYKAGGNNYYIGPKNEMLGECKSSWHIDNYPSCGSWKPSIHMPKSFSRIWLEVTDIKAERVSEITEEQSLLEGVCYKDYMADGTWETNTAKESFRSLWNKINGLPSPVQKKVNGKTVTTGYIAYPFSDPKDVPELEHALNRRGALVWKRKPLTIVSDPWVWAISFKVISKTGRPQGL